MNIEEAKKSIGKQVMSRDAGYKMIKSVDTPHGPYLLKQVTKGGLAMLEPEHTNPVPVSLLSLPPEITISERNKAIEECWKAVDVGTHKYSDDGHGEYVDIGAVRSILKELMEQDNPIALPRYVPVRSTGDLKELAQELKSFMQEAGDLVTVDQIVNWLERKR